MVRDDQLMFSDGQAITATANSTNVIDLKNTAPGILHAGQPVRLDARVGAAFNNLTNLRVDLVTADNAALSTNPVVLDSATVLLAGLTAGAEISGLQFAQGTAKRYLGLVYTVTGTAPTTGTVSAGLLLDKQTNV